MIQYNTGSHATVYARQVTVNIHMATSANYKDVDGYSLCCEY